MLTEVYILVHLLVFYWLNTGVCNDIVLTSSLDGIVCPGEMLEFNCYSNSDPSFLRWELTRNGEQLGNSLTLSRDTVFGSIRYQGYLFNASFLSSPNLTSSLTMMVIADLDGVNVNCVISHDQTAVKILQVATILPTMKIRRSTLYNGATYALVQLLWQPLLHDGQAVETDYNIVVGSNQYSVTTVNMLNLTVPYNINFSVIITAMSCSTFVLIETFKIVNCSTPIPANGVVIESYNSTTEGSMIYYRCKQDLLPNDRIRSVCSDKQKWIPDPTEHVCQEFCRNITSKNMESFTHDQLQNYSGELVFSGVSIFSCNGDSFPLGEFIAKCTHLENMVQCFPKVNTSTTEHASSSAIKEIYYVPIVCSVVFFILGTLFGMCIVWKKLLILTCVRRLRCLSTSASEVVYDDVKSVQPAATMNLPDRALSMSGNMSYIEHSCIH